MRHLHVGGIVPGRNAMDSPKISPEGECPLVRDSVRLGAIRSWEPLSHGATLLRDFLFLLQLALAVNAGFEEMIDRTIFLLLVPLPDLAETPVAIWADRADPEWIGPTFRKRAWHIWVAVLASTTDCFTHG